MSKLKIPVSWADCKVGDVFELKNGYAFKSSDFSNSGAKVVRISNIQDGSIDLGDSVFVKEKPEYAKFKIQDGDLLIAMSGATTGKMGIFNVGETALQNQRVGNIKIRFNETVDAGFRNSFFRYKQADILSEAYGGAQPNISGAMIESFQFPLPPLGEQKRIVAKIESTQEKVKTIESSISKAEELIERLAFSFLAPLSGASVGDFFEERIERFTKSSEGITKLVGVSNEHGVVPLRTEKKVDKSKYKWVQKGDLFYNPMRLNVGSIALYLENTAAITSPDYVVVRPKIFGFGWLLYYYIRSNVGQDEIKKRTKGSVRERVYFKSLSSLPFPLIDERNQKKVTATEALIPNINRYIAKLRQAIDNLKVALLDCAFSGRLVPQIPSEGTGHELLEGIKFAQLPTTETKATKKKSTSAKKKRVKK